MTKEIIFMKIELHDLVLACAGSMRKIIQLDDLIENLLVCKIIDKVEFDKLQDEFYFYIGYHFGKSFLDKFFDICNSPNYVENL